MKKFTHTVPLLLTALAFTALMGCNGQGGKSPDELRKDSLDSVKAVVDAHEAELAQLHGALADITGSLDSIAAQENMLFVNPADGQKLNKAQILAKLKSMGEVIARQRQKMAELQATLAKNKSANAQVVASLQKMVASLNDQLARKDAEIKALQAEVQSKNKSISDLQSSLKTVRQELSKSQAREQVVKEALSTQNEVVNQCYIRIGTKKELKKAGLLNTGFLRKKRVNYQGVDKSKFQTVDIRTTRRIRLNSDNPKILTPMPSNSSFHFEEMGDGFSELIITDPTKFWSVSNFLIIQL